MITSYYTTKLGLQPETIAYIERLENDGGEIISVQAVENAVSFLKDNFYTGDVLSYISPRLGIKKDSNNNVSKMYSLFSGIDFIQNSGSLQPLFGIDTNGIPYVRYQNGSYLRSESLIPVVIEDQTTVSTSAKILRSSTIRFLCREFGIGLINGFDPNSNAQHVIINGSSDRIGKRGAATLNGVAVNGTDFVNQKIRHTYTYDGSNNDSGFDIFIDGDLMDVVEEGNVSKLPDNMAYENLRYGMQVNQPSRHDMYDMIFIKKKLTSSQIAELNNL